MLALLLAAAPVCAVAAPPHSDYDGDGSSDVFWRNTSTGTNALWRSGDKDAYRVVARVADPAWHVAGQGDFDGDGRSDLLWRQQVTGRNAIWTSADFRAPRAVAAVADPRWTVAGVGDFDGDGRADIFWRNSVTGSDVVWRSALSSTPLAVTRVTNMAWIAAAIGDFDGDGRSDVLWRNTTTGANVIWRAADSRNAQAVASVPDPAWRIVGVGDFNGDGRTDVFWRNATTGADTIWNSANAATWRPVTAVTNPDWQVAATGDYNGDGTADLFWRNARTGADAIWNSASSAMQRTTAAVTDQVWSPVPREGQVPGAADPAYLASAGSPFVAGCDGPGATGTAYVNAEVEPTFAVSPLDPRVAIGAWQQDRWSNGSARGIVAASTRDGGATWTRRALPFSRCGGGTAGNGGDYARSTDPWITLSPNGTAYLMALSTTGGTFAVGSSNAMLVSRSLDGGRSWSAPATLIRDGANAFNDKNAITADPANASLAYAVWDRLTPDGNGPVYFTRTTNGGASWEAARAIYNPGGINQTIGNVVAVLPDGVLVDVFTQINVASDRSVSAFLAVLRSTDKGRSWSAPIRIADNLAVGTRDPRTGAAVRDSADIAQVAAAPDGTLYVVWQDARFSGGTVDGIALSRSTDGGRHWSTPVGINRARSVAAFVPSVHVRGDGTVGISYFDLRSDTTDAFSLLADYWLAYSGDAGASWRERRIAGTFDLDMAPNAGGYFLGDYQALASRGALFVPFFIRTNRNTTANRTDVFAVPAVSIAGVAAAEAYAGRPAAVASTSEAGAEFRRRVRANLEHVLEERLPSWAREAGTHGPP
jgi:hypothetical protein